MKEEVFMQVAINPSLYGTAQSYAEQRGLNLTLMIENYLERFINKEKAKAKEQEIPDVVVSLLGASHAQVEGITPKVARLRTGHSWNVTDEELKNMRYEYLMEKYK